MLFPLSLLSCLFCCWLLQGCIEIKWGFVAFSLIAVALVLFNIILQVFWHLISVPIGFCAVGKAFVVGQRFGLMHFSRARAHLCVCVCVCVCMCICTLLQLALSWWRSRGCLQSAWPAAAALGTTTIHTHTNNFARVATFSLRCKFQLQCTHTHRRTYIRMHRSFHNYTSAWVHLIGSYTVFACKAHEQKHTQTHIHRQTNTHTHAIFMSFLCALSCAAASAAAATAAAAVGAAGHCLLLSNFLWEFRCVYNLRL